MPTDSVMPSHHIIHCHPYLLPFLLLPSIFPYLMVFSVSQLFASGGRSIGSSAFVSVLPMNIQDWFPLGWTGWIFMLFSYNLWDYGSVQFSHSVLSDSLGHHGLQHARPSCPSPTPRAYSNSCPLSWWCYPTISSSVIPFSSHLQSFPASQSFQMSPFFASGGQNIGVSTSASVLPMNIQNWFPLGWTGWISLQSKGLSRVFSNTTVQKHQFFGAQLSSQSKSHIHTWPLEKP